MATNKRRFNDISSSSSKRRKLTAATDDTLNIIGNVVSRLLFVVTMISDFGSFYIGM